MPALQQALVTVPIQLQSFALSLPYKFNVDTAASIRLLWVAQELTTPLGFPIREKENNQDES